MIRSASSALLGSAAADVTVNRAGAFGAGVGVPSGGRRREGVRSLFLLVATFVALAVLWELLKLVLSVPDARLPHVWHVLHYLGVRTPTGEAEWLYLMRNMATTMQEAVVAVILALIIGSLTGILTVKWPIFGRSVTPLLVLSQTLPVVAIAPALVIWLGQGWVSKSIIAASIAFFPVAVSVARGMSDIPTDQRLMFHSFGSTNASLFARLELPNALTQANAAVPTAAALAVVGAIVAELPSGTSHGIAVVVLGAAQFYTFEPAALWCAALTAALGGMLIVYVVRIAFDRAARLALQTRYLPTGAL
jgi:NitT/TauT family transport system permease protein